MSNLPSLNNNVFGQVVVSPQRRSTPFLPWLLGTIFGVLFFIGLVAIKAAFVYFAWNLLLPESGFPFLTTDSAFGISSIITVLTMKYPSKSTFKMVIDLVLKIFIFTVISLCIFYY